jgi:hypothetical protein
VIASLTPAAVPDSGWFMCASTNRSWRRARDLGADLRSW